MRHFFIAAAILALTSVPALANQPTNAQQQGSVASGQEPVPYVEVHLSNLFAREPARQHSLLADRAVGFLCGFGPQGYRLALQALVGRLRAG